jgi:hypothetical protein
VNKWLLKNTLRRKIESRPIEQADLKYAYAAYKKGVLGVMGFADGMDAPAFRAAFEHYVMNNAQAAWVISTDNKNGFVPTGIAFGGWAPMEAYLVIIGIVWFPWASKRNILEGTVSFFNSLRRELNWMGFATSEHKRLYEVCCMHGIMRRVGTSNLGANPSAVYEGRR